MAEIEVCNVTKRFAGATAVRNASFRIRDGEFFILVGPSGCGKSTLLNMIVGLEEVSEGEIRVNGNRVEDLGAGERNMAMVFQSYAIYPHMSVRENMAFPLKLAGLPKDEIDQRVAKAAEILSLQELLERKPAALSGGQRQRVAMGRAIVREPDAFLLDEPLSNLDAKLRVEMRTEIARLQRRLGTTTIYVTHDQTEAMTLGDRMAVLHRGEVMQVGTPREVYERPDHLFTAGFIGSPPMNFVPARLDSGRLVLPIGSLPLASDQARIAERAGGGLIAGFRPEHLRAESDETKTGVDFEAAVETAEWLGADLFAYFSIPVGRFDDLSLPDELQAGADRGRCSIVARLDPEAAVHEGDAIRIHLDADRIQLFDATSGQNLHI